jgi:catechol 2,3-dioxygenase-like lactoylglutathione lyase family enzyme
MNAISSYRIKNMSPLLLVTDIDKSIEFYTKELGFEIDFHYEDFYSGISKNGYSIHLKSSGKANIETTQKRKIEDDADVIFSVEGLKDLYENISGKSVNIIQSLREMPYGNEFYMADPDGYVIAFLEEK